MKPALPTFPALLQRFFTQRLMQQKRVSAHTISSYRDTFRLLLRFARFAGHRRGVTREGGCRRNHFGVLGSLIQAPNSQ